jgi:hypothetical protein
VGNNIAISAKASVNSGHIRDIKQDVMFVAGYVARSGDSWVFHLLFLTGLFFVCID